MSFPYERIPDGPQSTMMASDSCGHHHEEKESVPDSAASCDERPLAPNRYAMALVFCCVFVGDTARGILFPTLWLFVQQLGGSKVHQGMVVASFSLGRILSSPILGTFSEIYGYVPVLVLSNTIIAIGCIGYAIANTIPSLVLSQVIIGFGSGTLGVTRSYIAENFCRKVRSEYMAYLTAVQYAGFTVTPVFGSIFSYLGYHYPVTTKLIYIDEFSVPALFMGGIAASLALALASFDLIMTSCTGHKVNFSISRDLSTTVVGSSHDDEKHGLLVQPNKENGVSVSHPPNYQSCDVGYHNNLYDENSSAISIRNMMILGGCAMNVFTKGTIGVFETLGSEYATHLVALSSTTTGYEFSILGVCGAITLVFFSRIVKYYDEVQLTISGIYLMIFSCVLMSFIPLFVPMDSNHHIVYSAPVGFAFLIAICSMYATGYPVGHTAVLCLFSKIQKNGPQGALLGWFAFSGSLARIIFPLSAGLVAQYLGDSIIFLMLGGVLCVALSLVVHYQGLIRTQCDL